MTEEVKQDIVTEQIEKKEPVQLSKTEQSAIEQGWVPKEEFQGEEHKWVDAGEFLRRGELFSKIDSQNRELKETKKTLEALKQHYLTVQEDSYKKAIADLKKQKKEALIENDVEAVLEVDEQIEELRDKQNKEALASAKAHQQEQVYEPHPEFVAWKNRNSWYGNNKPMSAFADAYGNELRAEGKSPSEVLRLVAEQVRKEFPAKFSNSKRDEPSTVEGGVSKGTASKNGRIELSELETKIMKKLVGQGALTEKQYMTDIAALRERS